MFNNDPNLQNFQGAIAQSNEFRGDRFISADEHPGMGDMGFGRGDYSIPFKLDLALKVDSLILTISARWKDSVLARYCMRERLRGTKFPVAELIPSQWRKD